MKDEIIVNCFRNPNQKIEINLDELNPNNKLTIKNNDENELTENENNMTKYYFNCLSNEKIAYKLEILILKNINIDLSKSNIQFKSIKFLSLSNSMIFFPTKTDFYYFENLAEIKIKGDLDIIKTNLSNLKQINNFKTIKQITLKILPKSSKVNIFKLLNSLNTFLLEIKSNLNIHYKGLLTNLDNNKEILDNEILSKIKKFFLFSLNKLNKESYKIIKEEIIDKMINLEELYLNENIECNLENKLKLVPIIDNCDDININFDLYNINKLSKIYLSICEYNKHKNNLILYGEANMSFYNLNNKELLFNIINKNHKGKFASLSLCNFDLENIDYLNDILKKSILLVDKLYLRNLNINQEFINIIKSKNLFNCYKICIENIIFNDDETENSFYEIINGYKLCKSLKLISLEDINKYNDLLSNNYLENLSLDEIYDISYSDLKEIIINKRKTNLVKISFKNLEINDDESKNDFIDIILGIKDDIKKLKLMGDNFNFIYKEIEERKIGFNKLEKLILNIDMDKNDDEKNLTLKDEDKIDYLVKNKNLLNYQNIDKIDLQIFNLSFKNKQKIFKTYNNLKELF